MDSIIIKKWRNIINWRFYCLQQLHHCICGDCILVITRSSFFKNNFWISFIIFNYFNVHWKIFISKISFFALFFNPIISFLFKFWIGHKTNHIRECVPINIRTIFLHFNSFVLIKNIECHTANKSANSSSSISLHCFSKSFSSINFIAFFFWNIQS